MEAAIIINEDLIKFDYRIVKKLSYFLAISKIT
jgi:hypothetical protein